MATKVMQLGVEVTLDGRGAITGIKKLEGEVTRAGKAAERSSKGFGKLGTMLGGLGVYFGASGLIRGITGTTKAFAGFEQQVRNVQNIISASDATMAGLSDQIRGLPPSLGKATDLTKGLYQALSSGVPKENAIDFMVENAKAAQGNLADLTTTISASSSILAAFKLPAAEVNSVLDSMTKTVDLGKLTFTDLANNIGKSASIAASAGVSYNELFAATAQLTLGGLSVEEAMTGIRAIMVATLKPTDDQKKAMQKYGVELSAAALQQQGFVGYMKSIYRAVGENAEAMTELIPNIRGLGPALALVRSEGKELDGILQQIEGSGGKVQSNFDNMTTSLPGKLDQMSAAWDSMKITIGEELAPTAMEFAEFMIDFLPKAADAVGFVVEQFGYLVDSIEYLVTLGSGLAAVFMAGKIQAAALAAAEAGAAFTAMGSAMAYVQTTAAPLALSIGAIGAAAYGAIKVWSMLADQMRENAEIDMAVTMQLNDQTVAVQNALSNANAWREEMDLQRLSVEEWADRLGVAADSLDGLEAAIIKEIRARQMAGKATEEETLIYDAFNGKLFQTKKEMKDVGDEAADTASDFEKNKKAVLDAEKAYTLLGEAIGNIQDLMDMTSEWAERDSVVWDQWFKTINGGMGAWAVDLKEKLDAGKISWEDFRKAVAEEYEKLVGQDLVDAGTEFVASTEIILKDAGDAMQEYLNGLDLTIPPPDGSEAQYAVENSITTGLSDALGKGFMGEWNSFSDLWDSLWQDAAKSMSGTITDGLFSAFSEGGGGFDALFGQGGLFGEGGAIQQGGAASVVGGIGGLYSAYQQGGTGGALQGAMSGAALGTMIMPGIGTAIGAVAGGLIGLFGGGGDKTPSTGLVLTRNGSYMHTANQDITDREMEVAQLQMRELYDKYAAAYRGILLTFEDASLFRMVGKPPKVDTSGGVSGMTVEDMFKWLSESELPELFESAYFDAISTGLQDIGMNAATTATLFEELGNMTGEDRIKALQDFVSTVKQFGDALDSSSWEDLQADLEKGTLERYLDSMGDIGGSMDAMMKGWGRLNLMDLAREAGSVADAFDSVRAATGQMLQAVNNLRDGIQEGWAGMIEDLRMSQMDEGQQIGYLQDQIDYWMAQLESADSLEGIDEANSNLADYIQQLTGMVDPNELQDAMFGDGRTWGEYLEDLMQQASDTATAGLDAVEDVVQEAYDRMVERLNDAADALFNFTEALTESDGTGSDPIDPNGDGIPDRPFFDNLNLKSESQLNLSLNIDGAPLYSLVQTIVHENMSAMYDFSNGPPVIE